MKGEVRLFDQVSKPVAAISCQVAVMSAASKLAFPKEFLRKSDLPLARISTYTNYAKNCANVEEVMLSPTVIGVGLHRLGLKSNFGQVEVQRGEAELDFNWTEIGLHWSCTR